MTEPLALTTDKIASNLNTRLIGRKILVFQSLSSTNDTAAEYAQVVDNDGLAIFAEQQTSGRGRLGRQWYSNKGESILCSIVLTQSKVKAELLSLTCAVALAEAVANNAKIKWPNDIILNGKKVAGILLESRINNNLTSYIIGIGINCHQQRDSFCAEIQPIATSIDIESSVKTDRLSLAKKVLGLIDYWLQVAAKNDKKVIDRWQQLSILSGKRISLLYDGTKFTGNCIGIDPKDGLILQLDTGGVRMFEAAHTTIIS